MIKAVVFDLDGTLVYFKIDYMKAREEVDNFLGKNGLPKEYLGKRPIFVTLENAVKYFIKQGIGEESIKNIKKKINRIVLKYELDAAKKTSLLPNAKEVLENIKNLGLKIGLFTINNRKVTDLILNKYELTDFFNAIITREDTLKIKPEKEHFLEVLKFLKVAANETVVVGDTIYDFMAPRKLGAKCIGIEGLFTAKLLISKGKVHYVVRDLNEIIGIIKKL
jgi:HAD superfamily hydrolase (TIGR01549 family)